ncbi:hypothetical protein HZA87_01045, partial [Candidatus Uhrbacteria bacterium]|nr:hypothetical protein [Candidatus Uhrbacteria bacterium]
MTTTSVLKSLRFPAAMLMLAGVLLLPALFVSAQEGGQNGQQDRPGKPGVPVQIVSIATGSNGS